jgi:hypothetical protein
MKKPRIEDFDPARAERKLGSPLDDMPPIIKPTSPATQPDNKPASGTPKTAGTAILSADGYAPSLAGKKRNPTQPSKSETIDRRYVRRTFDFYEDQIAFLLKSSLEERLAGGEGSMNAMVREALDKYIKEKAAAK